MGWPADLPLRTCSLGPDFGLVTGTDYGVDITVAVSRPFMTWGSTGAGAVGDGQTISIDPGAEQTFPLPVTDVAGWYIGGVPVDVSGGKQSHVYNLTIKPWTLSSSGRKTYLATTATLTGLAVPSGTGTLDLDKAAAMPGATGGTVTVPDYVAQLEAVAAAPTDSFVAARVTDPTSATSAALNGAYARKSTTLATFTAIDAAAATSFIASLTSGTPYLVTQAIPFDILQGVAP